MKIEETFFEGNEFLRNLLDSIPTMCLVVDADVRIFFYNTAATSILGGNKKSVYMKRGGDALQCISSTETPAGCGHAPACAECIIRNSVTKAIQGGGTTRIVTKMKLLHDGDVAEIRLMVSVSPFQYDGKSLA